MHDTTIRNLQPLGLALLVNGNYISFCLVTTVTNLHQQVFISSCTLTHAALGQYQSRIFTDCLKGELKQWMSFWSKRKGIQSSNKSSSQSSLNAAIIVTLFVAMGQLPSTYPDGGIHYRYMQHCTPLQMDSILLGNLMVIIIMIILL